MGRTERERREASQARLAAAGIQTTKQKPGGGKQGLAIAAVVLLVAVVAGLVIAWQSSYSSSGTGGSAAPVAATYQATRSGAVVTAGSPTAPATVDVYEDFLCPACRQFEKIYGDEITTALNQGKVKVDYHLIAILEERSTPPGYSSLAGGAGLCAADAGVFPAFHARLYADQPSEGGPGKTAQELVTIGQQLGAKGDFAGCVNDAANGRAILDATNAAAGNQAVAPGGQLSTPTVLVNGSPVEINDGNWLKNATGGA